MPEQYTPEDVHYGRAAYEATNSRGTAWEELTSSSRIQYILAAKAARNAPRYQAPGEALYEELFHLITVNNPKSSYFEDCELALVVAKFIQSHSSKLSDSVLINAIVSNATERVELEDESEEDEEEDDEDYNF